jgi:hypothetical protein
VGIAVLLATLVVLVDLVELQPASITNPSIEATTVSRKRPERITA